MTGITSTGLGSGLDIKTLVTNLVSAEQTPQTTRLDTQQADITTKISSYGNIKSAMSSFQSSLTALTNLNTFQKLTATSSDTSTLTVTASSNADAANYNVEVKQLAKSQTLASIPLSSATSTVGTGTLTIKFGTTTYDPATDTYTGFTQGGSQGSLTLNIDSSNNTLAGISNAINKANAGITAAVVTDNTGSRLVLNSTQTGANNSMEISVTDTGDGNDIDTSGLSALAFNAAATNMTQPQAAQDAKLAINGLDIVSSSNTVNTAIKGLSLNLQQAQPGKIVNVGIAQNNDDITTSINAFVKGYNDLLTIVNPLTTYDATNQKGGLLQGDATIVGAMAQLRSKLGNMVGGLNGSAKSLADIGISTQKDGTLTLDSTVLNKQLASNRSGVTSVFAVLGRPSNPNITYSSSTSDTKTGQYAVDITQAATQGILNGAAPSSLTIGAGNDTFAIKVDGIQSGTISLTQKTYTSYADLAAEMQSRINGDSTIKAAGVSIGVTYDTINNRMVLTSKSYGASSSVQITANTTSLGLSVGAGTAGLDVAGTIGGQAATGKGQQLTSTAGDALGLKLLISENTVGNKGTVDFSRGLIEGLNTVLTSLLSSNGTITSKTDSFQKSLTDIATARTTLADKMNTYQTMLYDKFNRMDALVGQMQSTASYLTQQFTKTSNN
jgi:flagellar hook-associated protein 2